jgi:hypothetical protein
LIGGPFGPLRNIEGTEREHVFAAGRAFLETLFTPVLKQRNRRLIAFKTPADIRHLDFLKELFPDAYFIHITRDGRDVSLSQMAKRGTFFSDLKEYRRLSFANVFRRWVEWERRVRDILHRGDVRLCHVRYENLIADPEGELRRITDFLAIPFEPGMLDYAAKAHDYPSWEAGSTDVAGHAGLSSSSIGKWRRERLTPEILYTLTRYDDALVELGYPSSGLSPSLVDRTLAAGFPIIKPVLDAVSAALQRLRPLLRDVPRSLVSAAWLLLAVQFLVPSDSLSGLGTDRYQPLICFAAAVSIAAVFGPVLLRRNRGIHAFLYAAAAMAAMLGALELAQELAPGRQPSARDFLFNAGAALVAAAMSLPFLSSNRMPLKAS